MWLGTFFSKAVTSCVLAYSVAGSRLRTETSVFPELCTSWLIVPPIFPAWLLANQSFKTIVPQQRMTLDSCSCFLHLPSTSTIECMYCMTVCGSTFSLRGPGNCTQGHVMVGKHSTNWAISHGQVHQINKTHLWDPRLLNFSSNHYPKEWPRRTVLVCCRNHRLASF